MSLRVPRHLAPVLLMAASGFAGLAYQIVWTQQSAVWLGHESASVLAVIAAFFGGLATGSLCLGSRVERSVRPVRWYAACESAIALWSVFLAIAMPSIGAFLLARIGVHPSPPWQWSVAFFGTFALLLPATAAMGATLPSMERVLAQTQADAYARGGARSVAVLYAANTFGAVIGVVSTAFWLIPSLGLVRTSLLCAAFNVLCGFVALAVFPSMVSLAPASFAPNRGGPKTPGVLLRLALTGFLGIGYEVIVVRVLSQVSENTVYTYAMTLAVYLVGSAIGAGAYERWFARRQDQGTRGDVLIGGLVAACIVGTATLFKADRIVASALALFGHGATGSILAEAVPALCAFGPPTIVMGALFSHLCHDALDRGVSFGRALGVNTLGAAIAPPAFGVWMLPTFGPKGALVLIAAGYLVLTARRSWSKPRSLVPALATLSLAVASPALTFVDVPPGGRVVAYQDGVMATVSVVEDADGVARLRINNRQQEGSSATQRVDGRQAWLPLLLHPAPTKVLFLGLGTGTTASSAARDPALEVDAVELLPEVIRASALFTQQSVRGAIAPATERASDSRLHVLAADARRYVRASNRSYDVIVSDNFHPARSGSGALYTTEHFAAVQRRLQADGVFCQWLPIHQLDLETLRSIVRSFSTVYTDGWAILANNSLDTPVLGLVGGGGRTNRFDAAAIRERLRQAASPGRLIDLGLEDETAVLGSFVAGPEALRRFAGDADLNTDDRPVVAYRAPIVTYAPYSTPRDRLIALLQKLSVEPDEVMRPEPDTNLSRRLVSYWRARDRFIESGRNVRPSQQLGDMLAQVREPLLAVLRISPDFRPAYDPLLSMAAALARTDANGARALLNELERLQPARPEATRALAILAVGSGVDPKLP